MADDRRVALPVGIATGIGSLPHVDPGEAVEFVLRHAPRLPFAPSLPARSKREGMVGQAASGISGISVEADGSLSIDHRAIDPSAPLDERSFAGDAFVGFRAFLTAMAERSGPIKISLTGPVTLGVALHAAGLRASSAFAVAGEAVRQRARAMLRLVGERVPQAEVIAPVDAVDLVSSALAVLETGATTGLHCCGEADWRLLLQSGPQILSVPTGAGLERAAGTLADFLERGGWVAWGAVPTDRPVGQTVERLWRQLSVLWCDLVAGGCDPGLLRTRALITPACGLARHGITQAEQVMVLATRLAQRLHDQAIGVRLSVGA
jgi:methionine synthase II (cobalamin-independent)